MNMTHSDFSKRKKKDIQETKTCLKKEIIHLFPYGCKSLLFVLVK
jgi:hypothetical protein